VVNDPTLYLILIYLLGSLYSLGLLSLIATISITWSIRSLYLPSVWAGTRTYTNITLLCDDPWSLTSWLSISYKEADSDPIVESLLWSSRALTRLNPLSVFTFCFPRPLFYAYEGPPLRSRALYYRPYVMARAQRHLPGYAATAFSIILYDVALVSYKEFLCHHS